MYNKGWIWKEGGKKIHGNEKKGKGLSVNKLMKKK